MKEKYHLENISHHSNLVSNIKDLLANGCFVDVTLTCGVSDGGQTIKAHKVVLAASSSYFRQVCLLYLVIFIYHPPNFYN